MLSAYTQAYAVSDIIVGERDSTTSSQGVANLLHKPAAPEGKDAAAAYKARLGIWMFLIYSLFYAGFVAINLFAPLWMERTIAVGLNFATVYGFALILGALILALIYDKLCSRMEAHLAVGPTDKEAN